MAANLSVPAICIVIVGSHYFIPSISIGVTAHIQYISSVITKIVVMRA